MNILFFSRLPTVTARIEDFIELSAPVPEKHCRLVKYDVPEVVCKVRFLGLQSKVYKVRFAE